MTIGGSIEGISFDGREFAVDGESSGNRDLGGFSNEIKSNGNGSSRLIQKSKNWMLEELTLSIDDESDDQEFLQEIADKGDNVAIVITYVSGISYQGDGCILGDIKVGSMETTAQISVGGPSKLTKQ